MSTHRPASKARPQQWDSRRSSLARKQAIAALDAETPHNKFLRIARTVRANKLRVAR